MTCPVYASTVAYTDHFLHGTRNTRPYLSGQVVSYSGVYDVNGRVWFYNQLRHFRGLIARCKGIDIKQKYQKVILKKKIIKRMIDFHIDWLIIRSIAYLTDWIECCTWCWCHWSRWTWFRRSLCCTCCRCHWSWWFRRSLGCTWCRCHWS